MPRFQNVSNAVKQICKFRILLTLVIIHLIGSTFESSVIYSIVPWKAVYIFGYHFLKFSIIANVIVFLIAQFTERVFYYLKGNKNTN